MHEMSVCLALLDQVRAIAADRQAPRATRIELDIGPLSGVEADLLRNAWPIASAGTIAAGADLPASSCASVPSRSMPRIWPPAASMP